MDLIMILDGFKKT